MLLLFKEDPTRIRETVAQHLAVRRNTIGCWLCRYARGGLQALLLVERRGPKTGQRTVPRPVYTAIQKQPSQRRRSFRLTKDVRQWIHEEFGLEEPYKSLYNLVRYYLGARLKVPGPVHLKKAWPKRRRLRPILDVVCRA